MSYDIAKGIYMCRKKLKKNKKDFAKLIGVSPETLSSYENGKSLPSIETIIKISEVVGTSVDEVMLLNYYVVINSSLFEGDDFSVSYFREKNAEKSKEFSEFLEECMKKISDKELVLK